MDPRSRELERPRPSSGQKLWEGQRTLWRGPGWQDLNGTAWMVERALSLSLSLFFRMCAWKESGVCARRAAVDPASPPPSAHGSVAFGGCARGTPLSTAWDSPSLRALMSEEGLVSKPTRRSPFAGALSPEPDEAGAQLVPEPDEAGALSQ